MHLHLLASSAAGEEVSMYRTDDGGGGWRTPRPERPDDPVVERGSTRSAGGPSSAVEAHGLEPARTEGGARRVWNPADGHGVARQQCPPRPLELLPDGTVLGTLWVPSEGPCRTDPGGAGGGPDGTTLSIHKVVWD